MPAGERVNLTLGAMVSKMLRDACEVEGCGPSEAVERALQTRAPLIDMIRRLPRDERGRTQRLCVLPESAEAPPGAEVFRVYWPLPIRKPEPEPEPESSE